MQSLLAEAIGTMMLLLLGDGVVANVAARADRRDRTPAGS